MSGIAGWLVRGERVASDDATLARMLGTLQHRGAETKGRWCSGKVGLGAAYPSASAQAPCAIERADGSFVLAVAGYVTNLEELGQQLNIPREEASSLSRVLLEAYLKWGKEFSERVVGGYAIAIWDSARQQLLLVRDRLGVKPLYYYPLGEGVLFGSEPKALMAHPGFRATLDLSKINLVLQPRLALPGETPLAGLHEVPAGGMLVCGAGGISVHRYWSLVSEPHTDDFDTTAKRVRELLENAVTPHLTESGAIGAMLSGGLDSSAIAAIASKWLRANGSALQTFCVRFDSDDAHFEATELRPDIDAPYAAAAAEYLETQHATIVAKLDDLLKVIPATRAARDLPGWGQFDASMYHLFSEMRKHCSIALTGEAADEFFGGYPYFFGATMTETDTFPWLGDGPRLAQYLNQDVIERHDPMKDERDRFRQVINDVPQLKGEDAKSRKMREVFFLGMAGPLSVILDRKDRMSMANGLDVRVPFCDHRLVQYVWNVPWAMKSQGGVKGLLKAAVADLLPPTTLGRKKSAYPHVQNPAYDKTLVDQASALAADPDSAIGKLFDAAALRTLFEAVAGAGMRGKMLPGGANPAYMLVHLVELDAWVRRHGVAIG